LRFSYGLLFSYKGAQIQRRSSNERNRVSPFLGTLFHVPVTASRLTELNVGFYDFAKSFKILKISKKSDTIE